MAGRPGPVPGPSVERTPVIQFLTDLLSANTLATMIDILRIFSWED
ncbi:hypothetical protein [Ornithinimicrobium cerasi]|nr:hypothetical protein [Ornithinimicrobium cerasi]